MVNGRLFGSQDIGQLLVQAAQGIGNIVQQRAVIQQNRQRFLTETQQQERLNELRDKEFKLKESNLELQREQFESQETLRKLREQKLEAEIGVPGQRTVGPSGEKGFTPKEESLRSRDVDAFIERQRARNAIATFKEANADKFNSSDINTGFSLPDSFSSRKEIISRMNELAKKFERLTPDVIELRFGSESGMARARRELNALESFFQTEAFAGIDKPGTPEERIEARRFVFPEIGTAGLSRTPIPVTGVDPRLIDEALPGVKTRSLEEAFSLAEKGSPKLLNFLSINAMSNLSGEQRDQRWGAMQRLFVQRFGMERAKPFLAEIFRQVGGK